MIERFEDLSIKKYRELIELERDGDNDTEYGINILSILSDMTQDELLDMPLDDFSSLMAKTKFLYGKLEKKDYKSLGKELDINGRKYRFIRSARDLTAAQYIDYKTYTSKDDFLSMLPYILTVFLIPDGHKYNNGYDIVEAAKEIDEHMDILTALAISDFFLWQSRLSILSSVTCLKLQMERALRKTKDPTVKEQIATCMEQMESLSDLLKHSDGYMP